jgi:hypothetical protein
LEPQNLVIYTKNKFKRLISITQNLKQTQATVIKAQPKVVRGELANIEHNQKQYTNRMHIESPVLEEAIKVPKS